MCDYRVITIYDKCTHTDRYNKATKEIFKLFLSTPQNRPNRLSKIFEVHEPDTCLMLTLIPYTTPYSGFQYCNHHKRTLHMTDYKIRHLWCNTSGAVQKLSISEYFQSALP